MTKKLNEHFFQDKNVVKLARQLIGKKLLTRINNQLTGGLIAETEAYDGLIDRASHAYLNKRTARTAVMYESGGRTYVYFCYGIHHLLNIVTGPIETPHAILIRSIIPTDGVDIMMQRRRRSLPEGLADGPGKVAQALGLTRLHNNIILGEQVWIEDASLVPNNQVRVTPRIGVDYAGPDKDLLWRFVWQEKTGSQVRAR